MLSKDHISSHILTLLYLTRNNSGMRWSLFGQKKKKDKFFPTRQLQYPSLKVYTIFIPVCVDQIRIGWIRNNSLNKKSSIRNKHLASNFQ